jgi:hypothetical protein
VVPHPIDPISALIRPWPPDQPGPGSGVIFDRQIWFRGSEVEQYSVPAGGVLPFATYWNLRRGETVDRMFITQWLLLDANGTPVLSHLRYLGYLVSIHYQWFGRTMREEYRWQIPASLPSGRYVLAMRVGWRQSGQLQLSKVGYPDLLEQTSATPLGTITITAPAGGAAR